jgi:hypothetical protein
VPTRAEIDDLERVIPQGGHEQPLSGEVDRQVVNPPFDAGQRDRLHQLEHRRGGVGPPGCPPDE